MPLEAIGGEISSQKLNNNFSYLDSVKITRDEMPYVNVKDYGAFENSDISAPYEAAVVDALSKGIHKIVLPPGKFNVLSGMKLREGLIIEGDTMIYRETGGTVLQCVGDINAFTTGLVDTDTTDMRSVRLSNFLAVGDKTITGKTGYGLTGSHLRYNVTLEQVGFKYFKDGIHLSKSYTIDLYKVLCNYNEGSGIYFENEANRVNMIGCEMNYNAVGCTSAVGTTNNQGILFQGCLIENNANHGALINGTDNVEFSSNYFEGNGGYNLYLRGELGHENYSAVLTGNRFYGTANGGNGVNIGDFTHNVVIGGGNHFENMSSSAIRIATSGNQNIVIMPTSFVNCTNKLTIVGTSNQPVVVGRAIA